ncbi:STAS domain-containing protein [Chitiniphilus purpureus]|uniref:STAS domain-containing protein n=1 Tax=Chitiniphilus purpureus TaxID=2981137 RepID=A0ABY6DMK7_9NEIS|nr:STAS domain-containing protein [Chitiniphilus sp. CD1]UXY15242.1 STAS domain-containing protein [Chitiniphilus sp. CD1]
MNSVALSGELTLAHAARRLDELRVAGEALTLDLSGVTRADSAALALLLAWQRRALAGGTRLSVVGAPGGLLQLARLYGVTDLLPFARESL